jgi:large conductance mechanosensitive channel
MPRLDENTQQTLRDVEQGVKRHTAGAWDSFSNFALRDNVLEVAVGLMQVTRKQTTRMSNTNISTSLAASFTACANSLVSSIILPVISLLPFLSRNLDSKFAILQSGPNYNTSISNGYNTPKQAVDDGAVVLAYGDFLDKIVRFLAIAMALWMVALAYSRSSGDNIVKKQVRTLMNERHVRRRLTLYVDIFRSSVGFVESISVRRRRGV